MLFGIMRICPATTINLPNRTQVFVGLIQH